ncbi:glucosamine-6-phosphate deaminase [[Mycoplasma] collis]|uniref:glucosamine-6-phosphate deaminase n=1 Tax=[Mycoplasma] collis TaxID=2127 RepID=UPI00051C0854|nr:glucosamine-6-phosphate deaminase [[Mycoplasma] collis]
MNIIIKENEQQIADFVADIIKSEIKNKPNLNICFATGKTPIKTYQKLIEMYQNKEIDFSQITTFNLDEYVNLEPTHPSSYHYFMNKNLFNHINVKKENIYLPNGIGNIEKNSENYENIITKKGGIDLMILGIGTNGHIAFNEPGSTKDQKTREVKLTQSTIESNKIYFQNENDIPKTAISMGIGTILKAKKIILLASGSSKAVAIEKAINGPIDSKLPASFLQEHEDTMFVIDNDAAELL